MNVTRIYLRIPFLHAVATLIALFSYSGAGGAYAQGASVEEILEKADKQRQVYVREFQNLIATETKHFETFGEDGVPKKRRVIRAVFVILQVPGSETGEEFRHVLEVDGKAVEGADVRAQKFFEKTSSSEAKERKRIYEESLRHDLDIIINGFTRNPSPVLEKHIWPFFDYKLLGMETLSGNKVYKITFQQMRPCPFIWVNRQPRSISIVPVLTYNVGFPDFEEMNESLRGTLYIDIETFRIVREERALTIFPKDFPAPVLVDENVFEYQPSPFGIRTPRSILHTNYEIHFKQKRSTKRAVVRIEYSSFSKPDVEVRPGTLE